MSTSNHYRMKPRYAFAIVTIFLVALGACWKFIWLPWQVSNRLEGMGEMQLMVEVMYNAPQVYRHRGFWGNEVDLDTRTETVSWRTTIWLGSDLPPVLNEPWNSAANRKWENEHVDMMRRVRPGRRSRTFTQIFALTGPGTAFSEYSAGMGRDFLECEPDAILLMDRQNKSIHWMQPMDIRLEELLAEDWKTGIGNLQPNYAEGFIVAFADGAVWQIRKDVPREAITKFFTVESAKLYDREEILGPYAIEKLPPLSLEERSFELRLERAGISVPAERK